MAMVVQAAPVVVYEREVSQYRTAAAAATTHLPGATQLEPNDPGLANALHDAPVIVAVGRKALAAVLAIAHDKPVVFSMVLGVTRADVSNNVTGVPLESDPADVLARIHQVLPHAKTLGVVYDPNEVGLLVDRARVAAQKVGISLVETAVSGGAQARDACEALAPKVDALWIPPEPRLYSHDLFRFLLTVASERKVPLFGFLESSTRDGALGSVSPDFAGNGDRAGQLAEEIAALPENKRIPVPGLVYAPGDLSLNLGTARAFGLDIPAGVVASAGSHVIP